MRLLKPSWLHHDGNPIFSIDIHPDDTRVVTGGQGNDSVGRVVIWNMQPILSKHEDLSVPKLLCQLDHHNACVNCVRWSNSGKFLCSGGDDRVIIVWKLVSKYSGGSVNNAFQNSAFGKTNLEQWKTTSMLRSHTGDVLDLAWSPGDRFLASASVDNTVIIWDAQNFPQIITTIRGHESLVKGVTWDPVGKYLASQSDDKTLKIWRVSDWELEHAIQNPFVECGGTTHVLRLDWSPDGSYLVSAHAMNGGGPTAQIIERTEWNTDKDFVGHRKAVVCVKFNGNILQNDECRVKHCCVALGSRDRSVSIWSTALKRPLVVIKDLFTNSVMDLSWSSCGTVMMACSWDGSVAVAQFSLKEIGKPLSLDEKANFFHKHYGKSVSSAADNCDIIQNLEVYLAKSTMQPVDIAQVETTNKCPPPTPIIKGPIDKQIETRTADGRRRITPKFLLPPTEGELTNSIQSEQAIFMQVKSKEDVVANSQTSAQDWRKSMVSSIENVKAFAESAPPTQAPPSASVTAQNGGNLEENGAIDQKIEIETGNENNDVVTVDQPVSMEVDTGPVVEQEIGIREGLAKRLVVDKPEMINGNGIGGGSQSGEDSRTKSEEGVKVSLGKDKGNKNDIGVLVNGTLEKVEMDTDQEKSEQVVVNGISGGETETGQRSNNKNTSPTSSSSSTKAQGKAQETEPNKSDSGSNGSTQVSSNPAPPPPVVNLSTQPPPPPVNLQQQKKDSATGASAAGTATPVSTTNSSGQPANLIPFRKKNKNAPDDPAVAGQKPTKRVKLLTPGTASTGESEMPKLHLQANANQLGVCQPQRTTISGTSPSKIESSKGHHRLPALKADGLLSLQVTIKQECNYSLQVTNHYQRPDGLCHQVQCIHTAQSLNGLEWTVATDAPICGLVGDQHRIGVVCENATLHLLDVKGRYAVPPITLSGQPSKILLSGPFLVIVTAKAVIHVWNVHTKSVVLKSESLLPLLVQTDLDKDRTLDIARIQVAAGGLPMIVLNTGKTFIYSADFCAWMLISDPRGLVSGPLMSGGLEQSVSSRMMLFTSDGRLRNKPEPSIVTHIKLKLATSTELKNPEGVKQWLIALAKALATHGLQKELHQLCEDLLGPTHSAARLTSKWAPKLLGVIDKRQVLRQILTLLLEDLKYQDLYSEFDEVLRELESESTGNDMGELDME